MLGEIFDKAKSVLTEPTKFFNSVKKEKGFSEPVKFYAVTALVYVVILTLLSFAGFNVLGTGVGTASLVGTGVLMLLLGAWLINIVTSFLAALILYISVYIFGGRDYPQTYKAVVYSTAPNTLFAWVASVLILLVPSMAIAGLGLTLLLLLYGLYLLIKGISILHNMTMGKAGLAVVAPIVVVMVIALLLLGRVGVLGLGAYNSVY